MLAITSIVAEERLKIRRGLVKGSDCQLKIEGRKVIMGESLGRILQPLDAVSPLRYGRNDEISALSVLPRHSCGSRNPFLEVRREKSGDRAWIPALRSATAGMTEAVTR